MSTIATLSASTWLCAAGLPASPYAEVPPDKPTVPITYLDKTKEIPPFLIIHGNKDRLVPFGQSVLLYKALEQNDKPVVMYKLDGADHGGSPFWTDDVLEIVDDFLREHL